MLFVAGRSAVRGAVGVNNQAGKLVAQHLQNAKAAGLKIHHHTVAAGVDHQARAFEHHVAGAGHIRKVQLRQLGFLSGFIRKGKHTFHALFKTVVRQVSQLMAVAHHIAAAQQDGVGFLFIRVQIHADFRRHQRSDERPLRIAKVFVQCLAALRRAAKALHPRRRKLHIKHAQIRNVRQTKNSSRHHGEHLRNVARLEMLNGIGHFHNVVVERKGARGQRFPVGAGVGVNRRLAA
ncbi:MAG: hypothetical protein ALAOOOJD_03633 [bacterium]|nr:hypothetical protein [bacterium]